MTARKAAQPPGMRCLLRLFTKWVLEPCERIGREDEPARPMFTHVVTACDERERVKMEGAIEALEIFLAGSECHGEEDIFVTMLSYGVLIVALVLFWVRLFDVYY